MPRTTHESIQVCPFSSGLTTSPGYANLNCLNEGGTPEIIQLKFRGMQARKEWTEDFCNCFFYKNCVIYQALEVLMADDGKQ